MKQKIFLILLSVQLCACKQQSNTISEEKRSTTLSQIEEYDKYIKHFSELLNSSATEIKRNNKQILSANNTAKEAQKTISELQRMDYMKDSEKNLLISKLKSITSEAGCLILGVAKNKKKMELLSDDIKNTLDETKKKKESLEKYLATL